MAGEAIFTADEADYIAANRLWYGRSVRQRWLGWLALAVIALAAIKMVIELRGGMRVSDAIGEVAAMMFFAAIAGGARLLIPALLPRQVRRMMSQNAALREPMRCCWNDDGIFFAGGNGTADLRWNRLHRWRENDATFVFLQTDRLMFIVPRRSLSSEQADDLRATVVASGLKRR